MDDPVTLAALQWWERRRITPKAAIGYYCCEPASRRRGYCADHPEDNPEAVAAAHGLAVLARTHGIELVEQSHAEVG